MASATGDWERALVAGTAAAIVTSLLAAPLSSVHAAVLIAALLALPALAVAGVLSVARRLAPSWVGRPLGLELLVLVHCAVLPLGAGAYATNLFIVDAPLGAWARCGYALTLLATAVVLMVARRQTRRLRGAAPPIDIVRCAGGLLLLDAVLAGVLDNYGIRSEYPVHGLLLAATLGGLVAGFHLLLPRRLGWRPVAAAAGTLIMLVLGTAVSKRAPLYHRILAGQSAHARVLLAARALTDRDHDGFSAWFGGGDCNDASSAAYPLSPVHDCLGWRTEASHAASPLPSVKAAPAAPHVILLLTIDAFRCGFGRRGPSLLRNDCPALTRLAGEGWSRLDAHATVPITTPSMTVLMTGDPTAKPRSFQVARPTLPGRLHDAGYATEVLVTFKQILGDKSVASAFDHIDTSLQSIISSPFRGEQLTDLALEQVGAALRRPRRTFIWAHYPDPHFPFIVDDGSPWKRTTLGAYAKVVRRTDAAIGRLVAGIGNLPGAADVLVVITADHGEEFGEHGQRYHGYTLFENAVRVPIIAWSPVDHRRFYDAPPPRVLAGLAGYILGAVGSPGSAGEVRSSSPAAPILLRTTVDHQLGVIANGWKLIYDAARNRVELFHLTADPEERHDLHATHPDQVERLGRVLGSLLAVRSPGRPQG